MQPVKLVPPPDVQQGKLISKVEVPAFIPRADLCEQLTRWALGNAQDDGLANFGCAIAVTVTVSALRCGLCYLENVRLRTESGGLTQS
jgi:hypothetical protein